MKKGNMRKESTVFSLKDAWRKERTEYNGSDVSPREGPMET